MNRRNVLGATFATAASLRLSSTLGEESATPAATPAPDRIPLSSQPGFVRSVSRAWSLPAPSFEDVMRGRLLGIQVSGVEFDTPDNAGAAISFLIDELPGYFARTIPGVGDFEVTEEPFDPLGDETVAQTITLALPDQDVIPELLVGVVIVRKDALVQAAAGYGIEDAAIQVYELVVALDDRWPAADLWAMVPEAADIPDDMVLEEERERGPGE